MLEVKINTRTPWKTKRAIELINENIEVGVILNSDDDGENRLKPSERPNRSLAGLGRLKKSEELRFITFLISERFRVSLS